MIAMRFHSVVFALATNTPFIAIDYTLGGKITGLLTDLGLQDRMFSISEFNHKQAVLKLEEQYNQDIDNKLPYKYTSHINRDIVSTILG